MLNDLNPVDNNCWLITLQTDTLLGSPDKLDESNGKKKKLDESSVMKNCTPCMRKPGKKYRTTS